MSNLKARRERAKQFIKDAKDKPCADCGFKYAVNEMTFDHVRGTKLFTIGECVRNKRIGVIAAEVAKCDVVCRPCHDIREYVRGRTTTPSWLCKRR